MVKLPSDSAYGNAALLRRKLKNRGIIMAPGVFNPIAALVASKVGFNTLYFSGGGFAMSMGLPDLGIITMSEMVQAVRYILDRVKLPLIVDVDTGFGEAINIGRAVHELENMDVAALHIEDQVMPKKCGHLPGKQVVGTEEMVKRIVAAKESTRKGIVLIARTDARAVEGMDATVERARAYAGAGADMIFPEALKTREEFKEFSKKVGVPLLANMTEFGESPYMTASELERIGYKIVIFPMTALRASLMTMEDVYSEIKRLGTQRELLGRLMTREDSYGLIDYYSYEAFDSKAARSAAAVLKSL